MILWSLFRVRVIQSATMFSCDPSEMFSGQQNTRQNHVSGELLLVPVELDIKLTHDFTSLPEINLQQMAIPLKPKDVTAKCCHCEQWCEPDLHTLDSK